MRKIISSALILISLSGCAPLAMFANGHSSEYKGLRNDWGTYVTSSSVNALCLNPKLRLLIWDFEGHFGRKVVMNSGYRDRGNNSAAGGAESSFHMKCMAADFHIPGVPKEKLIQFAMGNGLVGGLGCYPDQKFIHVDVRDRPNGRNRPVTFSGC